MSRIQNWEHPLDWKIWWIPTGNAGFCSPLKVMRAPLERRQQQHRSLPLRGEHLPSSVSSCDRLFPRPHWSTAAACAHKRGTVAVEMSGCGVVSLSVFRKQTSCQHPEPSSVVFTGAGLTPSDQILFFHPKECCSEITSGGGRGGREGGQTCLYIFIWWLNNSAQPPSDTPGLFWRVKK